MSDDVSMSLCIHFHDQTIAKDFFDVLLITSNQIKISYGNFLLLIWLCRYIFLRGNEWRENSVSEMDVTLLLPYDEHDN